MGIRRRMEEERRRKGRRKRRQGPERSGLKKRDLRNSM